MVDIPKGRQNPPRSMPSPTPSERSDRSSLSEKARGKQRLMDAPSSQDNYDTASEGGSSRAPTPPPKVPPKTAGLAEPRAARAAEPLPVNREIFADRHEADSLLAFIKAPGGAQLAQQLKQLRSEADLVVTLHAKMGKPGWQQTPPEAQAHDLEQLDQALSAATEHFFHVRDGVMAHLATPQGVDPEDLAHRLSHTLLYPEILTATKAPRVVQDTVIHRDIATHRQRLGGMGGYLLPQEQLMFAQRSQSKSPLSDLGTTDDEATLIEPEPVASEVPKKGIHFLLPERPARPMGREAWWAGAKFE